MASHARETAPDLSILAELQQAPYRYQFHMAVRRLDCHFRDAPRTGEAELPRQEPVRFGQPPSLAFAPSSLASFQHDVSGKWHLAANFFGMFGPNGPLPLHLTEYAYEREHRLHDVTLARFLDLFHHRFFTLFYRAWAAGQPTVQLDRPDQDRFADFVGSLCGLGTPAFQARDAMPDHAKLTFAGHLSCQTVHPSGLQAMLEEFFGLPTMIHEFVGHWLQLPEDCVMRLGVSTRTGKLGDTATLGTHVFDRQQKFQLTLGPMPLAHYCGFLQGGTSLARLIAIIRNYVGDTLIWDVRLVLDQREVPPLRLGQIGQLGWTTWLGRESQHGDADDLVLAPVAASHATAA